MKKTFIALGLTLAAAVATPALAESVPQRVQFTYEGVTYTYTKTQVGKSTIYKGVASTGEDFYLVSRNGYVTGKSNGTRVSFRAPSVETQEAFARSATIALR